MQRRSVPLLAGRCPSWRYRSSLHPNRAYDQILIGSVPANEKSQEFKTHARRDPGRHRLRTAGTYGVFGRDVVGGFSFSRPCEGASLRDEVCVPKGDLFGTVEQPKSQTLLACLFGRAPPVAVAKELSQTDRWVHQIAEDLRAGHGTQSRALPRYSECLCLSQRRRLVLSIVTPEGRNAARTAAL
jgi:hypothetical protein